MPIEINLQQSEGNLEIAFDDGSLYNLSCEYLRILPPSAEVRADRDRGLYATDKEDVKITTIQPVGSYAIQLVFDDGHDTVCIPGRHRNPLVKSSAVNLMRSDCSVNWMAIRISALIWPY